MIQIRWTNVQLFGHILCLDFLAIHFAHRFALRRTNSHCTLGILIDILMMSVTILCISQATPCVVSLSIWMISFAYYSMTTSFHLWWIASSIAWYIAFTFSFFFCTYVFICGVSWCFSQLLFVLSSFEPLPLCLLSAYLLPMSRHN